MKQRCLLALFALLFAAAGCSTPSSRIEKNSAAFAGYPPAVQAKIKAGEIEIGYTPEMVQMALGKPDRVFRRTSAEGQTEIWAYADKSPSIGIGLGFGSFGHHSGGGVAVGTSTGGDQGDKMHVSFKAGKVSAIDRFGK